jgi:hypothetical protein
MGWAFHPPHILVSGNKEQLSFCLPFYAIREFFFGSVIVISLHINTIAFFGW